MKSGKRKGRKEGAEIAEEYSVFGIRFGSYSILKTHDFFWLHRGIERSELGEAKSEESQRTKELPIRPFLHLPPFPFPPFHNFKIYESFQLNFPSTYIMNLQSPITDYRLHPP
jgi:hypothetical protein